MNAKDQPLNTYSFKLNISQHRKHISSSIISHYDGYVTYTTYSRLFYLILK